MFSLNNVLIAKLNSFQKVLIVIIWICMTFSNSRNLRFPKFDSRDPKFHQTDSKALSISIMLQKSSISVMIKWDIYFFFTFLHYH